MNHATLVKSKNKYMEPEMSTADRFFCGLRLWWISYVGFLSEGNFKYNLIAIRIQRNTSVTVHLNVICIVTSARAQS